MRMEQSFLQITARHSQLLYNNKIKNAIKCDIIHYHLCCA